MLQIIEIYDKVIITYENMNHETSQKVHTALSENILKYSYFTRCALLFPALEKFQTRKSCFLGKIKHIEQSKYIFASE